eukprot:COSAG04_NODE_6426_length_1328_cov_1.427990_2_plen_122_part_00
MVHTYNLRKRQPKRTDPLLMAIYDALPRSRWTAVDDEYLTEPGNWIINNGYVTETSDAYGNNPGDDAMMGTYFMLEGVYDEFIAEIEVVNNDNDGVGFLFAAAGPGTWPRCRLDRAHVVER